MRKIVPKHLRKKALFSCDRCKTRKIGCKRFKNGSKSEDINVTCVECMKRGHECITSLDRKKKSAPQELLGLHYKCLVALVENLYPDIDLFNVDALIQFGERLGVSMPPRNHSDDSSFEELQHLGSSILNQVVIRQKINSENQQKSDDFNNSSAMDDRYLVDKAGIPHFIGLNGSVTFLSFTSEYLAKSSELQSNFQQHYMMTYKLDAVACHDQPFRGFDPEELIHFPYIMEMEKRTADLRVNEFFDKIYPYFPCVSHRRFMGIYERFWKDDVVFKGDLTISEIGLIYMVIVLGFSYNARNSEDVNSALIGRAVRTVTMVVSEFVTNPDVNGITTLYLLSLLYDKNRRREPGFLLMEAATRLALVLGLHRRSRMDQIEDPVERQEITLLWWCIYQLEVKTSVIMGRISSMAYEEITNPFPILHPGDPLSVFNMLSIKLCRLVHEFQYCNRRINSNFNENKKKGRIIAMVIEFDKWLEEALVFDSTYGDEVNDCKINLKLQYYHYVGIFLFQFLMEAAQKDPESLTDKVSRQMISRCIKFAVETQALLTNSERYMKINRLWSLHLWFAHHACLALCVAFVWLKSHNTEYISDIDGSLIHLSDIKVSMILLRNYNLTNMSNCIGTTMKTSKYTEVLLGSFNFMEKDPTKLQPEILDLFNSFDIVNDDNMFEEMIRMQNFFRDSDAEIAYKDLYMDNFFDFNILDI